MRSAVLEVVLCVSCGANVATVVVVAYLAGQLRAFGKLLSGATVSVIRGPQQ